MLMVTIETMKTKRNYDGKNIPGYALKEKHVETLKCIFVFKKKII